MAENSESATKTIKMMDIIKDNTKRYASVAIMAAEYIGLQLAPIKYKPDAIIAGLPVYHTQKEGHAASDEVLKYRSMGTIFLAHQKGGKRTFKCTLRIHGPARLYVLSFFQALQKNGVQENIALNQFNFKEPFDTKKEEEPFTNPTVNSKIRYMSGYDKQGDEMIAYHKTIPIITDTKIYSNMYLETLRYTEDIKIGKETFDIDLAFREFIPPLHVKWFPGDEKKKQKGYFTTWITDEERSALRRVDLMTNMFWASRPIINVFTQDIEIEQKQTGRYAIEGSILSAGLMLAYKTIWGN